MKDTVVFSFGRFNPPTSGHEKLMDKVAAVAKKENADFMVFPSHSQNPKKDPLSHKDKVNFMRKMFPRYKGNIMSDKGARTAFNIVPILYDKGYKRCIMVVGGDRVVEFKKTLNKYNGVKGKHGFYDFENGVEIVSAGERDPDAEGVTGMSASKMRAAAAANDYDSFEKGLPSGYKEGEKVFDAIRKGMNLSEEMMEFLESCQDELADFMQKDIIESLDIMGDGEMTIYLLNEVRQDSDIKDKNGSQPAKYYASDADGDKMSKSTKDKRAAHFKKNKKGPAPGDKGSKTKESEHTKRYKQMYGEGKNLAQQAAIAIAKKKSDKYDKDGKKVKKEAGGCWDGYKPVGMKKKGNRMVPNCVPEEVIDEDFGAVPDFATMLAFGMAAKMSFDAVKMLVRTVRGVNKVRKWAKRNGNKLRDTVNPAPNFTQFESTGQNGLIGLDQIKKFESVVDKLFAKYDIDFNFTRHFGDRMDDSRNNPSITLKELAEFIKKMYKRQGKSIKGVAGTEAVLKDIQSDLNIPVAVTYDSNNDEFDVVLKTIMRKKNFTSPDKVIKYEDRDYKKERKNYLGTPEQMERNAARKRARRLAVKNGIAKEGDGRDVHHKDGNPLNNDTKNLSSVTVKYNRTEPRKRNEEVSLEESALQALRTATKAHKGQFRKSGGEYIAHPKEVAKIVAKFKSGSSKLSALVQAAYLHDTIEDTNLTHEDLVKQFGGLVANLVNQLTTKKDDLEAAGGKGEYIKDKMVNMTSWALVIKLADRLANVSDIATQSPAWQKKYGGDTKLALDAVKKDRKDLSPTHRKIIKNIEKIIKPYVSGKVVQEKLDANKNDVGDYVKDFKKSNAPQFKGKSTDKRKQMAIAAYLAAVDKDK